MEESLIELHLRWLARTETPAATFKARRVVLRRADRDLPYGLELADDEELSEWLYGTHQFWGREQQWSRWTWVTYWGHLNALFRWATDPRRPRLDYNPMTLVDRPSSPEKIPRPASDDQLVDVLDRARPVIRICAVLAAYGGLRCKEVAGLWREHVTEKITYIVDAKGGNPQAVPTHPMVWQEVAPLPAGPIVAGLGGRSTPHWVTINAAAGFRGLGHDLTLHRFRHWYATTMQADTLVRQQAMRHKSVTSTQGYTLIASQAIADAVMSLPSPDALRRTSLLP